MLTIISNTVIYHRGIYFCDTLFSSYQTFIADLNFTCGLTRENESYHGHVPTYIKPLCMSMYKKYSSCMPVWRQWTSEIKNVPDDFPTCSCARCSLVNQSYVPKSASSCYYLVSLRL